MVGTLVALQSVLGKIELCLRRVMRHARLVPQDLPVLSMLVVNRSMTGSLLADRLGRLRQNVQVSLARLERDGLVESWKDDTGRVGGWSASDKGFEKWMQMRKGLEQRIAQATNGALRERPVRELKDQICRWVELEGENKEQSEQPAASAEEDEWDRLIKD